MKSDPRDYKLDISSLPPRDAGAKGAAVGRPYLSVMFKCCQVYQRVYRNAAGTAYEGRCPKCSRTIRFVVGEGGSGERTFVVE